MEAFHAVVKLGLGVSILLAVLVIGAGTILQGAYDHCWNPMGCIDPQAVAEMARWQKYLKEDDPCAQCSSDHHLGGTR